MQRYTSEEVFSLAIYIAHLSKSGIATSFKKWHIYRAYNYRRCELDQMQQLRTAQVAIIVRWTTAIQLSTCAIACSI